MRWKAVSRLARLLWERTERTVSVSELTAEVREALQDLHQQPVDSDVVAHQIGTLLVRDEAGNFGFIHQSVIEWLGARVMTQELNAGKQPGALIAKEILTLGNPVQTAIVPIELRRVRSGES